MSLRNVTVRAFSIILLLGSISFGQMKEDLDFILKHDPAKLKKDDSQLTLFANETSELKIAFLGMIKLYQRFVSSQNRSVCNFTQSCSDFGMEAIRRYGIFHGGLMASDRIQRCNGVGRKYYPVDQESGLCMDFPLQDYHLGGGKRKTPSF